LCALTKGSFFFFLEKEHEKGRGNSERSSIISGSLEKVNKSPDVREDGNSGLIYCG